MCSNPNIKYPSINVISPDELVIANVESIGSGVFGNCFVKAFTRLGINVVEKQLNNGDIDQLYNEAKHMQVFSHRCIPHLFGIQVERKPLSLIMEFVEENNQSMTVYKVLYDPTAEKTKLGMSIADWLRICYDIADGLDHMHQKGYLHCDLKTNNVLISKKKGYIIDFGKVRKITHSSAKKYKEVFSHIAPEVLQGSPASTASDVYSLGKILKAIAQEVNSTVLLHLGKTATSSDPRKRDY